MALLSASLQICNPVPGLLVKKNKQYKLTVRIFWWFQLENGYTFHDYNIKLNDVIQLMVRAQPEDSPKRKSVSNDKENTVDTKETNYKGTIFSLFCTYLIKIIDN